MRRPLSIALIVFVPSAIACGTLLGIGGGDDTDNPGGGNPPPPTNNPGTTGDGAVDLDANVVDCTNRPSVGADDLYATPTSISDRQCTTADPCSFAFALERSKTLGGRTINLAPGRYVRDIELTTGTRLVGGWSVQGSVWSPICDQRSVELQAVTHTTVRAKDAPNIALTLVTLLSSDAQPAPSETRYGVFVTGPTTRLTLESVKIGTGPGGAGLGGANGVNGPDPPRSCSTPSDGVGGLPGTPGAMGAVEFGESGLAKVNAVGGGFGALGNNGTAGGEGAKGSGALCAVELGVCKPIPGGCSDDAGPRALPGTPGCGGLQGERGAPGANGGGSIAVFAWAGAVVITRAGLLVSGNGGGGGAGGLGAAGGAGQLGAMGSNLSAPCFVTIAQCSNVAIPPNCLPDPAVNLMGGTPGGPGGAGGAGGRGGGGAGGPSFIVVTGADAGVDLGTTLTSPGLGGDGGDPNGPSGPSGLRGP